MNMKCEALNVILREVESMKKQQKEYVGIAFERGRTDISVLYDLGSFLMGQRQLYPGTLWKDICLAMRLIGRMGRNQGCPEVVRMSEDLAFQRTLWTLCTKKLVEKSLPSLEAMLARIDEIIAALDAPFDTPSIQNLGTCSRCGAGMIMMDGSNDICCPEGCLI